MPEQLELPINLFGAPRHRTSRQIGAGGGGVQDCSEDRPEPCGHGGHRPTVVADCEAERHGSLRTECSSPRSLGTVEPEGREAKPGGLVMEQYPPMGDLKPPRLAGPESITALTVLQYQRESFLRKVSGVRDGLAAQPLVPSGTSLLWLTNHMADAERTWLLHRFEQRDPSEDPPHAASINQACERYRATWDSSDRVICETSLDAVCPAFDDGPEVSLRWIVLHLLEETARHAGHADILRELLDGSTGR